MTTIDTARLHMRPISTSDRDVMLAMRQAPEVLRWLPWLGGSSLERYVESRLAEMVAHWDDRGYGVWLVQNPRSRKGIGYCGLRFLDELNEIELLYAFDPVVWGWGLASEAARAALHWVWSQTDLTRIMAMTLPDNLGSRGVMENVGMRYERDITFHGYDCVYYAIAKPSTSQREVSSGSSSHVLTAAEIAAMPEMASTHALNSNAIRQRRSLGDALNLQRLGLHYVRVEPGRETTQFHFHHHEEEFVYILSGRGIAEVGDRQFEVGPGDLLAFTAPSAPHAMSNPFAEDLIYLMGGERRAFDLCDYPRLRLRLMRASGDRVLIDWDDLQPFGAYPFNRLD